MSKDLVAGTQKKDSGQAGMTKSRNIAFFCHSRKRSASGILLSADHLLHVTERIIK